MVCLREYGRDSIGKKIIFNKEKFIEDYDKLKSSREMAKLYNCNKTTILNYARKIGYKNICNGKLSNEQKEEKLNQYEEKTRKELAKQYNVNRGQITKLWKDHGLIGKNRNKYPFNYNYFETINSADKAYFLGLLAADGCIHQRDVDGYQATINLSLQKVDRKILEIFKIYIECEKPLKITEIKNSYVNYMYSLQLVSTKMANDLAKYNVVPRKTYDYEFVELDHKYMSHFFRGYFDGDGSIFCTNNKYHTPSQYEITISGFQHNLLKMQRYLYDYENINSIVAIDNRDLKKNKYNLPFGNLRFNNIENNYKFIKYIYQDIGDIYLPRKKYVADCFLYAINNNFSNKQNLYNNILMPSQMKPTSKSKIISREENWKA